MPEFENELYDFVRSEVEKAKKMAARLINSNDEYIKLLIKFIKYSDKILLMLNSSSNKMYVCYKNAFILPDDETVNLPYINIPCDSVPDEFMSFWLDEIPEADVQKNDVSIEKPYGDSWFSPNAHADEKLLKEEYRNLAKKYHPDVAKTKESKTVFQEINNERADILDNFE